MNLCWPKGQQRLLPLRKAGSTDPVRTRTYPHQPFHKRFSWSIASIFSSSRCICIIELVVNQHPIDLFGSRLVFRSCIKSTPSKRLKKYFGTSRAASAVTRHLPFFVPNANLLFVPNEGLTVVAIPSSLEAVQQLRSRSGLGHCGSRSRSSVVLAFCACTCFDSTFFILFLGLNRLTLHSGAATTQIRDAGHVALEPPREDYCQCESNYDALILRARLPSFGLLVS